MDEKIVGRRYDSTTLCVLEEDGNWKATNDIVDSVLYEGATEWRDEKVSAMAYDDDPQKAIQTAMNSTLNFLLTNVYQNGFKGLIEYRDFERLSKEAANDNSEVASN